MKLFLLLTLTFTGAIAADTLRSAKITQAVNDVKIYQGTTTGRAASIGESLGKSSSVTTGRRSRAELTFQDSTITRLGQNSVFSFRNGTRDIELKQGSILLQVPKSAGGATIRTATVTAAITGTTSMCEYSPGQWVKLLTLEGTQKLTIKGQKEPMFVPAGQMIVMHPDGRVVPAPITIDLAKLVSSSVLAGDKVFAPLPKHATDAIAQTVAAQKEAKRRGALLPTNHVITGSGARNASRGRDARLHRDYPDRFLNIPGGPGSP
ncbi:FecR domain-containing protein [Haloferula sp.]|uniref:FecR domain-containing protein n=1 Tax=Haloferula sp. TaxID=2497595 RepID=UPI0032A0985D